MSDNVFVFENKVYEKTNNYLVRLSNILDYYFNNKKIEENNFVIVPFAKCPFYTIDSIVIYNPREVKGVKLEKHFSKSHFATPISFSPNYKEFDGVLSKGHFFRKCFYILERDVNEFVFQYVQFIPITPKTIQHVARCYNYTYTDYLYKLKKECPDVSIFNLHNGTHSCNERLEQIT